MKKKLISLFIFFVLFHAFVKANENILELDPNIIAASTCNGMITANAINDFDLGILSEERARNIVRSVDNGTTWDNATSPTGNRLLDITF